MPGVREALGDLLRDVIATYKDAPVPRREWTRVRRYSEGVPVLRGTEIRPDPRPLLDSLFEDPDRQTAFAALVSAVESDQRSVDNLLGQEIAHPERERQLRGAVLHRVVVPFLETYFATTGCFSLDEPLASRLADALAVHLAANDHRCTNMTPIVGVHLASGDIRLDNYAVLRSVTEGELEVWLNERLYMDDQTENDLPWAHCLLQVTMNEPTDYASLVARRDLTRRVVKVLRLVAGSRVGALFTVEASAPPEFFCYNRRWSFHRWESPNRILLSQARQAGFALDRGTSDLVVALWRTLSKGVSSSAVTLAVERWFDAFDRVRDEDRLIDYWVALEALFGDGSQEIRYKASMRIPAYLGGTQEQRLQLHECVGKSYGIRSDIVHANVVRQKKPKPGVVSATSQYTGEILRLVLLRALRANSFPSPQELDQALLIGKTPG